MRTHKFLKDLLCTHANKMPDISRMTLIFISAVPAMFPGWPPMGAPPVPPGQPPPATPQEPASGAAVSAGASSLPQQGTDMYDNFLAFSSCYMITNTLYFFH